MISMVHRQRFTYITTCCKYVSGVGSVYISPYNTLVASYEQLLGYTGLENSGSVCTPTALNNALGNRFEDVLTGSTGEIIYML